METGTDGLFASDGASFRAALSFVDIASEADSRWIRLRQRKRTPKARWFSQKYCTEQPVPPAVPKMKGISHGLP